MQMKLVYKDLVQRGFAPNPLPRGVVLEQSDVEKLQSAVKDFLSGNDNKHVENTATEAKSCMFITTAMTGRH
jgi:hypothetical protein